MKRSPLEPLEPDFARFLAGGGEMGSLLRSRDWGATYLGEPAQWPQSLKTAIRIMLTSRQPIWIGWGRELTFFYNDAYRAIIGGKHPAALGRPDGSAGGIICANTDDTKRVISDRQLTLLRELSTAVADTRWCSVCEAAASALGTNRHDVPFAMIYLGQSDATALALVGSSGITADHPAAPPALELDDAAPWPSWEVLRDRDMRLVADLAGRFGKSLPTGSWHEPSSQAALLPIVSAGEGGRHGVLIVDLSPLRLFDGTYVDFLKLIPGQIAGAVTNADAYEQERLRAEALAKLDSAKTAFFSNVSHEFRTPLTLMLGPLEESLAEAYLLAPRERERVEIVHRNGMRLLKLVNTLLDFSRIEAGKISASLPSAAANEADGSDPAARAARTDLESRSRILLADDNADMREYISRLLRDRHECVTVNDGREALDALRLRRPDLLLTDLMMPRLDGFALIKAVREDAALRDLPIIVISARAGEESSVEGLEAGADDYLVKPFSARELIARVDGALAMARMRREVGAALRDSEERLSRLNLSLEPIVAERTQDLERANEELRAEAEERAKIERVLRQSQKMEAVGKLTVGIAHDFNNLLQVIGGNLQLLAKDVAGIGTAEQRVRSALAGVSRGSKLASQLLSFGRRQPLSRRDCGTRWWTRRRSRMPCSISPSMPAMR